MLEEENSYWMNNEKLEKKLQGKEVAFKAMIPSLVDVERNKMFLETESGLLMTRKGELRSYSSQSIMNGGHATDKLLKNHS